METINNENVIKFVKEDGPVEVLRKQLETGDGGAALNDAYALVEEIFEALRKHPRYEVRALAEYAMSALLGDEIPFTDEVMRVLYQSLETGGTGGEAHVSALLTFLRPLMRTDSPQAHSEWRNFLCLESDLSIGFGTEKYQFESDWNCYDNVATAVGYHCMCTKRSFYDYELAAIVKFGANGLYRLMRLYGANNLAVCVASALEGLEGGYRAILRLLETTEVYSFYREFELIPSGNPERAMTAGAIFCCQVLLRGVERGQVQKDEAVRAIRNLQNANIYISAQENSVADPGFIDALLSQFAN